MNPDIIFNQLTCSLNMYNNNLITYDDYEKNKNVLLKLASDDLYKKYQEADYISICINCINGKYDNLFKNRSFNDFFYDNKVPKYFYILLEVIYDNNTLVAKMSTTPGIDFYNIEIL